MNFETFHAFFYTVMQDNGLSCFSDETYSRKFYQLTQHMLEVSKTMNLTAIKEERGIIPLHYADSLFVAQFLPKNASVADIGCGAGFPCLPLAICRPDLHITAIDSTEKRIQYVNGAAELLHLPNLYGISMRAEDGGKQKYREKFDIVLARAVAELPILAELCLPYVRQGGRFFAMKATRAAEELEKARAGIKRLGGAEKAIHERVLRAQEETYMRAIIEIEKVAKTPPDLPRAYTKILKNPL